MTQNEMIRNLAEKCSVDSEEARTALEIGEWNMLTAAQLLESEKLRKAQEIEAVVSACETATAQATAEEPPVDAQTTRAEAAEPTEAAATAGEAEGKRRAKAAKHCGGRGLEIVLVDEHGLAGLNLNFINALVQRNLILHLL